MRPEPVTVGYEVLFMHLPRKYEKLVLKEFEMDLAKSALSSEYTRSQLQGSETSGYELLLEGGGVQSEAAIRVGFDGIRIMERQTGITVERFSQKVREILELAFKRLEIRFLFGQVTTVRSIFEPTAFNDSRDFLANGLCDLKAKLIEHFKQVPPVGVGLTLHFIPKGEAGVEYRVALSPLYNDVRRLLAECTNTFDPSMQRVQITPDKLDLVEQKIRQTYDFLNTEVHAFLDKYDRKETPK